MTFVSRIVATVTTQMHIRVIIYLWLPLFIVTMVKFSCYVTFLHKNLQSYFYGSAWVLCTFLCRNLSKKWGLPLALWWVLDMYFTVHFFVFAGSRSVEVRQEKEYKLILETELYDLGPRQVDSTWHSIFSCQEG